MTVGMEALLGELTQEVRNNTRAYITMEAKLDGLRTDYGELREMVGSLATTQAIHAERLTVNETRVSDMQHFNQELATLKAQISGLTAQAAANAPVRTPWTAVGATVTAVIALLWTLFGR